MVFVRDGFTAKKMQNLEIKNAKPIYLELTIVKKKWCILFTYCLRNTEIEKFLMKIQLTLIKH